MINYVASLMLVVSELLAVVEFLSSYQIPVSGIIQAILLFFWRVVYKKSSLCINDVVEKRRIQAELKQKQIDVILKLSEILNEKNKTIEHALEGGLRTIPLTDDESKQVEVIIQHANPNKIPRN
jgi:hypothetical protein